MERHTNMVKENRKRNAKKEDMAITAIRKMLTEDEQVVVCALVRQTGLSRAYFYENENVRAELKRAQELQEGKSFVIKKKVIFDKAMEKEKELLTKKVATQTEIIMELRAENEKLKKALNKQTIKELQEL